MPENSEAPTQQHIDRSKCPLCGAENQCAREKGETGCWCAKMKFPKNIPQTILSCFCKSCVEKMIQNEQNSI